MLGIAGGILVAERVEAKYDELEQLANRFMQACNNCQQMMQEVQSHVSGLQGDNWVGQGANAFYNEMGDLVFPAMRKLIDALQTAAQTSRQVAQVLHEAEETCQGRFMSMQ
jgi:WXG100 family type VII secretion target